MDPWRCCRLCMGTNSLEPLFRSIEKAVKYSTVLSTITGLNIKHNDKYPQKICTECAAAIKNILQFKKKCKKTYQLLRQKLELAEIKRENNQIDFDYNDSPHSGHDSYTDQKSPNTKIESVKKETNLVEHEWTVDQVLKKGLSIEFINIPPLLNFKNEINITENNFEALGSDEKPIESVPDVNFLEKKSVKKKSEPGTVYSCEICQKQYKNNSSYLEHKKLHNGKAFMCEHCGNSFQNKRKLLIHCRAKHGYERADKCSFCEYRGISAESVKIHERLHTGEKPYVCELCSASFHRKSSYIQHKPMHLTEKTVPCDQCPAMFKSVTLMKIHKTRHKPRKYKYKCLTCGNQFGKRWHCLQHVKRVHGQGAAGEGVLRVSISDPDRLE